MASGFVDRIGIVDAVDLGRLEQDLGVDLDGAQAGRGVGGEERVAGACAENHHPPLLEMAHRAASDVVLADLVDAQRRHDPGVGAQALESVLQRQRIDHRGEHPHVIGRHPVHAGARQPRAAEDVAAAQYDRDLDPHLGQLADLAGDALEDDADRCRNPRRRAAPRRTI